MAGLQNIRAGGAFVELGLKDMTGKALNQVGRRFRNWGRGLGRMMGGGMKGFALGAVIASGFAAATAAIELFTAALRGAVTVAWNAVKAAGAMEESMNVFNVAFKGNSEEMINWSKSYGDSIGRSRKFMVDSMGSFRFFAGQLGMVGEEGDRMAQSLTALSVDLGSFWNMADPDVAWRLRSALQGNHEAVRLLNIALSDKAIQQWAEEHGIAAKNLTEQQKRLIRYNLIVEQTKDVQGDAARTIGSFENQMKVLNARIENLALAFGQALMPYVQVVIGYLVKFTTVLGSVPELIPMIVKWLVELGKKIWEQAKAWTNWILGFVQITIGAFHEMARSILNVWKLLSGGLVRYWGLLFENMGAAFAGFVNMVNLGMKKVLEGFAYAAGFISDELKRSFSEAAAQVKFLDNSMEGAAQIFAEEADKMGAGIFKTIDKSQDAWNNMFDQMQRKGIGKAIMESIIPAELREAFRKAWDAYEKEAPEPFKFGGGVAVGPGGGAAAAGKAAASPETIFRSQAGTMRALFEVRDKEADTLDRLLTEAKRQTAEQKKIAGGLRGV